MPQDKALYAATVRLTASAHVSDPASIHTSNQGAETLLLRFGPISSDVTLFLTRETARAIIAALEAELAETAAKAA